MYKTIVFVCFFLACFLCEKSQARPLEDFSDDINSSDVKCYNQSCPKRTTACKKVVETSKNKKNLEIDIFCLDNQDDILQEHHLSEANPYNAFTYYKSTSYSGTYTSVGSGGRNKNINIHNVFGNSNDIEDIDK